VGVEVDSELCIGYSHKSGQNKKNIMKEKKNDKKIG